ncbi:MAG: L-threonylcarbamoyladenylate synthase, partial [Oceanococcaceae bacterium]
MRRFDIHPTHPQPRLIRQAADALREGQVLAIPTDSTYAYVCAIDAKEAAERIRRLRNIGKDHLFTLICPDLSTISQFARVDNWHFRLLRSGTPGPYTFILKASHQVPRRVQGDRRKTVGVRVCAHPVSQALVAEMGEPLLAC